MGWRSVEAVAADTVAVDSADTAAQDRSDKGHKYWDCSWCCNWDWEYTYCTLSVLVPCSGISLDLGCYSPAPVRVELVDTLSGRSQSQRIGPPVE